ncbi:hypothetical protein RND71_016328 [Anisodus tanguticus]|uniref:Uncharacterized protein n=1 Tax=Anisodus tanguticus TaxID=243964 RepID=A0AAE1S814_9SOLA|nr:hypothetical protein RND71_016328 [Anisodus tanguticus]
MRVQVYFPPLHHYPTYAGHPTPPPPPSVLGVFEVLSPKNEGSAKSSKSIPPNSSTLISPPSQLSNPKIIHTFRPKEYVVIDSEIEDLSGNLRNLRKINISGNSHITDRSLVALSMNCLNLQAIEVEDTSEKSPILTTLTTFMTKNTLAAFCVASGEGRSLVTLTTDSIIHPKTGFRISISLFNNAA